MRDKKIAQWFSFIFMGMGQIYSGFYFKGIVLGIMEIIVILNLKNVISTLQKFYTLGTKTTELVGFDYIPGDNSLQILCNGTVIVIILAIVIIMYVLNVIDAGKCCEYVNKEKKPLGTCSYIKSFYNKNFVILMLIPAAAGILFFIFLPVILTILVSFTNYSAPDHIPPKNLFTWVGIINYFKLAQLKEWSSTFIGVGTWTVIFAITATFLNFSVGFALALLTSAKGIRFNVLWRGLFILPYAVPAFVSLLVFRLMLNPAGPINNALSASIPFLTHPTLAKITILVINTWLGAPYFMVLLSGALTNISESLYEAARIDGASKIQQFLTITLPIILFQTAPVMIMTFAYNFNNFGAIYFLTDGWPSNSNYRYAGSTDILLTWVYKMTGNQNQFAAVISVVIFIFVAGISLTCFLRTKSFKNEGMLS